MGLKQNQTPENRPGERFGNYVSVTIKNAVILS